MPDEPAWFWGKEHRVGSWQRAMAIETAIHRWDAQNAMGKPEQLEPDLAAVQQIAVLGAGRRLPIRDVERVPAALALALALVHARRHPQARPGQIELDDLRPGRPDTERRHCEVAADRASNATGIRSSRAAATWPRC